MIMASTDAAQGKVTKCNNSSAGDCPGNIEKNSVASSDNDSVTNAITNNINNNDAIESTASPETSPLIRFFDFDESNYSYVLGYN